eukprot:TRINITY_DN5902_c0_g1_i1.p1 TRINITY_DN5902_c0_g1~~TRINITY_DN5902_c0_g1_i1.p1  ORF type:complete len:133 (-),score=9.01 TRINITY_DN5902_c0_g1_i1:239-610(-)
MPDFVEDQTLSLEEFLGFFAYLGVVYDMLEDENLDKLVKVVCKKRLTFFPPSRSYINNASPFPVDSTNKRGAQNTERETKYCCCILTNLWCAALLPCVVCVCGRVCRVGRCVCSVALLVRKEK